jgi:hypothetical protein
MSLCCPKQSQAVYKPRRPEKTVLFEIIKKRCNTWHKNSEKNVPKYIDKEFKKYLGCGILAKGFACAHCANCDKDFFIAFSCKGRGLCRSCNTRAMVETAAHLAENVIPQVPVRQFVISFPIRIRHYLQTHKILQAVLRIIKRMDSNEGSGFSLNANVRIPSWDREGLERLIRYCARPCFKSENLRWNGPWIHYRLPKPTHTGKTFIQLEPLEFIERISHFIPYPRRHRRHYHGVFAPNSPFRKNVAANAKGRPKSSLPPNMQESVEKIEEVSLSWAKLIARIYDVNPLLCSCGKEMKITSFVLHPVEIRRILTRIGWPTEIPEFDPPYDFPDRDICQLLPWTEDGFPSDDLQVANSAGPDHPFIDYSSDPPLWDDHSDPPPGWKVSDPVVLPILWLGVDCKEIL